MGPWLTENDEEDIERSDIFQGTTVDLIEGAQKEDQLRREPQIFVERPNGMVIRVVETDLGLSGSFVEKFSFKF